MQEVLDVMKRLSQIEREMLELRSKQTKMNADAKVLASQGASKNQFQKTFVILEHFRPKNSDYFHIYFMAFNVV